MQKIYLRSNKFDRDKEHLWTLYCDTGLRIIKIQLTSLGTVSRTFAEPFEIFSYAIKIRASRIIICHNHPSGILTPSKADIDATDRVLAVGKFLNIQLLDHLVITESQYFSFFDEGLLSKIQKESVYDLSFVRQERISNDLEIYKKVVLKEVAKLYKTGKTITAISKKLDIPFENTYDLYREVENNSAISNTKKRTK